MLPPPIDQQREFDSENPDLFRLYLFVMPHRKYFQIHYPLEMGEIVCCDKVYDTLRVVLVPCQGLFLHLFWDPNQNLNCFVKKFRLLT